MLGVAQFYGRSGIPDAFDPSVLLGLFCFGFVCAALSNFFGLYLMRHVSRRYWELDEPSWFRRDLWASALLAVASLLLLVIPVAYAGYRLLKGS